MINSGVTVAREALAALSRFTGATRLYALDLQDCPTELVVERWQGHEALSSGFEWWVDVLSTNAHLPLDPMIGRRATLWTRMADGGRLPRSGLVREAACLGGDGGLARYRLCLVPWTWLLGQGRHSRVFEDMTVLEIVAEVLAGYAPLARWQVADEVGPFLAGEGLPAPARPRSYCVQYRESDADFIARLLAEEGLGWRLEEVPGDDGGESGHQMVVFSDSAAGSQDPSCPANGALRLHRYDGAERGDAIQILGQRESLGPGQLTVLTDDYRHQVLSASAALEAGGEGHRLEAYDFAGPYAFATQTEGARYAGLMAEAAEASRHEWRGRGTVRSFRAGEWFRVAAPSSRIPSSPSTPSSPRTRGSTDSPELLLLSVRHFGINNLPDVVRDGVEALLGPSFPRTGESSDPGLDPRVRGDDGAWGSSRADDGAWGASRRDDDELERAAQAVGYANAFTAIPRTRPWRPVLADETGLRLNPRPTAPGYQTAIVVGGGDGGEIHADAMGRVRVRFHFQDGSGPANDSCWLRVSQRYAGPGVGSQFLPRVGQEVLVGFLEGDIDRPIVVGSLYNGRGEGGVAPTLGGRQGDPVADGLFAEAGDHRPSAQGNLSGGNAPAWHGMSPDAEGHRNAGALSGFKSKEICGEGHNRLVFDDTDGQLRLQLATTHGHSELNLGHLVHQADNYRGSFRGEGFELRTDQWGAIRGARGVWISAWAASPDEPAGDHVPVNALLRQVATLAQAYSDIAGTHLTVRPSAAPLQALDASARSTVDGTSFDAAVASAAERSPAPGANRVPHTADALLALSAPAGIGFVAGQSLHWTTGETLTLSSGAASNAAVAGHLRIHTAQAIGWLANAGSVPSRSAAFPPLPLAGEGRGEGPPNPDALSLVAAQDSLHLEAQTDDLKLQARDTLQLTSTTAQVDLTASKALHLATSGGASITIEDGNIRIACPGEIRVHAQKKEFVGPAQLSREMNSWPEARFERNVCVRLQDGTPAAGYRYELERADGALISGVTDEAGRVPLQRGLSPESVAIRITGKERME
ncbi:type VI secretion system Vgr family protein [Novilysobacter defluvii]|uniref:Type IV secretion protein Rhs n=1 Tax=Lysobacter defluvii IMMIB APB-9 = DSM 18482 TaxID=1385515 RepID=A0A0A0M923_9GAMM|nr:type VI secretion system Vgr family protein [Lysobacter defluvii]KGO98759.1 type IV secretion protein Rhs [Lysobacter defluvii IMMIB APB-9 = DSM 18482]